MTRLQPIILTRLQYDRDGEDKTMYSEKTGNSVSSIDFSRGIAVLGLGLRPTGTAIPSSEDKVSFKSEVEGRCVRCEWLDPVWEEPF